MGGGGEGGTKKRKKIWWDRTLRGTENAIQIKLGVILLEKMLRDWTVRHSASCRD